MLFKPLAKASYRTFVRVWRRMRSVETTYRVEQDNRYPVTSTLADLGAQFFEE